MALTATQKYNAALIVQQLIKAGVTNKFTHSAVLAVISKETGFNPGNVEVGYSKTSNARIRQKFSKTKDLTDAQLNILKANDVSFFNFVYNGIAGNGAADGYKYRGRGYNQLTGKSNYATMGKAIGVDLVANPDMLTQPSIAAKVAVVFFVTGFNALKKLGKATQYNSTTLNGFKNYNDSLGAIYHINAGIGHSNATIKADVTGGLAKAKAVIKDMYDFALNHSGAVAGSAIWLLFFWA
jgi:putative chitinase